MKKIMMTLICVAILVGGLMGCTNQDAKTIDYNDLTDTDKLVLETMSKMIKTCDENGDKIWAGQYKPQDLPLILVSSDVLNGKEVYGAFAFNIEKFDDDMQVTEITNLPSELGLDNVKYLPYVKDNKIEQEWAVGYNFSFFDLQGVHGMYVRYYPGQEMKRLVETIVHEGFHEFKQYAGWKGINDLTSTIEMEEGQKYEVEHVQLDMMISSMLSKSLTMDGDELKEIISDSLLIRAYYYQMYPFLEKEKECETVEGTAQLVYYAVYNMMEGKDYLDSAIWRNHDEGFHIGVDTWNDRQYDDVIMVTFYKDLYYEWGSAYLSAMDRLGYTYVDGLDNEGKLIWDYTTQYFLDGSTEIDEATFNELKQKYNYDEYYDLANYFVEILNTHEKVQNIN